MNSLPSFARLSLEQEPTEMQVTTRSRHKKLPPLHKLRVAAAPTGTPVPDTEDLLAVWAAHTTCNICMGFLALNPSAVEGEEGTPWQGPPGSKAWVVVCATGRGHAYHKQCIQERRRADPDAMCPECQQPIVDYGEDVPLPPLEGPSGEPARPELPEEVWGAADKLWEAFDEFDAETGEIDREASAEKRRKFSNNRGADVFRAFSWRVMDQGFGDVDDEGGAVSVHSRPELPQEVWDAADAFWEKLNVIDAETGALDREASAEKRRKFFNNRGADVFRAFSWRVMKEGFGEAVMEVDDEEDGMEEPPDNAQHLPTMEFDDAPRNFVHPAARAALLEFYDMTIGGNSILVDVANQWVAEHGLHHMYDFTDRLAEERYKQEFAQFHPGEDYKYGTHYDEDDKRKWADTQSRWEGILLFLVRERMKDTDEYRAALSVREMFMSDDQYDAVINILGDYNLLEWAATGGLAQLAKKMANSLSIDPRLLTQLEYENHVYYLLYFAKMNLDAARDEFSDNDDDEEPAEPSVERQRSHDRPLPTLEQARLQRREARITETDIAQKLGVTPAFFDSIYTLWKRWSGVENEDRRRLNWTPSQTFSPAILWADVLRRARSALPDARFHHVNPDEPAKDRALQYVAKLFSEALLTPTYPWATVERTLQDLNHEWRRQRAVETYQSGEAGPSGVNS